MSGGTTDRLRRISEYEGIIQQLKRMLAGCSTASYMNSERARIRKSLADAEEGLAQEREEWNKFVSERPVMPSVGKTYRLTFPSGESTVATLDRIERYPATGMPNDFIFRYVSGYDGLAKISSMPGLMPLPEGLIPRLKKVEEVLPKKERKNGRNKR